MGNRVVTNLSGWLIRQRDFNAEVSIQMVIGICPYPVLPDKGDEGEEALGRLECTSRSSITPVCNARLDGAMCLLDCLVCLHINVKDVSIVDKDDRGEVVR